MLLEQRTELTADRSLKREISKRLHNTAQPLTVLQGVLELALLNARTPDEYRDSCQQAIAELRQVTECFDRVRDLVRA
jgi:signal transduction histidine kinase